MGKKQKTPRMRTSIKMKASAPNKPRSRAVSTKRTILSPFTKEYRVHAANSGIRLFLEGFPVRRSPQFSHKSFKINLCRKDNINRCCDFS